MSSARSGPPRAGRRAQRDPRAAIARIAAPLALLAGVTVAALLIRSGLAADDAAPPPTQTPAATAPADTSPADTGPTEPTPPAPAPPPTTPTTTEPPAGATFYTIESGDTLESIAADYGTTVEVLLELNPEIDPVALTVGQRIRVS